MKLLTKFFEDLGAYCTMMLEVCIATLKKPPQWKLILTQLFDMGLLSLPVVAITGLSTGMVLAAQSYFQLADKGLAGATGLMVTKSMLVELGPVLTAFMITGRVGAAVTAELGSMKVTEQIDALSSMAVHPFRYLIAPRCIAMTLMVPVLTVFSCAMGILGGYITAVLIYGMPSHSFFDPLPAHIGWFDLFSGFFKSLVFGMLIVSISCFRGLKTQGGAAGVGRATTNSVVICYSSILIFNFIITVGLNAFYWKLYGTHAF